MASNQHPSAPVKPPPRWPGDDEDYDPESEFMWQTPLGYDEHGEGDDSGTVVEPLPGYGEGKDKPSAEAGGATAGRPLPASCSHPVGSCTTEPETKRARLAPGEGVSPLRRTVRNSAPKPPHAPGGGAEETAPPSSSRARGAESGPWSVGLELLVVDQVSPPSLRQRR